MLKLCVLLATFGSAFSLSSNSVTLLWPWFTAWCSDVQSMLCPVRDLTARLKPSTLWSRWSMLKATLSIRHKIDLDKYKLLKSLLSQKSRGYIAKKSKVFTANNIENFSKSDDLIYLSTKVILIFGICGAMRCKEIVNLRQCDVEDNGKEYVITIKDTKTPRIFIIGCKFYSIVKKYVDLRPKENFSDRFFICYSKGKCTQQNIGKHKIADVPKTIALYLNLPEPELYTGHCMRRTSATLLSDSGANLNSVKQLGGWKSSSVAEGYIENSKLSKQKIFQGIAHQNVEPIAHCSKVNPYKITTANEKQKAWSKHNEDESSKTKKINSHSKQPLKDSTNKNVCSTKINNKAISNPNLATYKQITSNSTPKTTISNTNLAISSPIPVTSTPNSAISTPHPSASNNSKVKNTGRDSEKYTKSKRNLSDDDDFGNLSIIAHNSVDLLNDPLQNNLNGFHTLKLKRCKINQFIILQRPSDLEKIIKKNKFASSTFIED